MGTRGPAPKRESQRRRQNKPERPVDQIDGAVPPPALAIEDPHPLAVALYNALTTSPEAAYLTPAAWQRAQVSAHVLSMQLNAGSKMSAMMYTAIQTDWKALLIDPGELRRLGIEVKRVVEVDEDDEAAVAELDAYRAARTS